MVAEVRRMAAKGCHAFTFSENPEKTGFPSLHNEWWDPFWAACADEGTMVCFHIGSSSEIPITSVESPVDVTLTLMPVNIVQVAADIIWSDFLRRYPSLKVCLSEGGIGWVPYFLERVDRTYHQQHRWTGQDFGGKVPSDVFREHIVTCFVQDRIGVELRHEVGLETITWEVDYPHSDSTWPHSPEAFAEQLDGVPDDEVRMIGSENAMRHFRFDPFAHRPPEQCTVGALRAEASGVDTTTRSTGTPQPRPERPVLISDIAAMSGANR
jgi:predicted TIM-barrel fold metal-dependent hydrolase